MVYSFVFSLDDGLENPKSQIIQAQNWLEKLNYLHKDAYTYGELDEATLRAMSELCDDNIEIEMVNE